MPHSNTFSTLESDLQNRIQQVKSQGRYRQRRLLNCAQGRQVSIKNKDLLNFCANDYLGLANDERIKAAFKNGVDKYGVGTGASHLVCGHNTAHHELESAIASFTGRESALVFSSGYSANTAIIKSLVSQGDSVFQDRLNHASLLDGAWSSRADVHWFDHKQYDQINALLDIDKSTQQNHRRLIVSDGVFSMDGDTCDLNKLKTIAAQQHAWLMIDDAHGIGVLGKNGQGIVDPQQYSQKEIPILVGTFGKAFGTSGAFVAGSKLLIEWLIQKARNYIFTTAMPSAIAAATLKSIEIVQNEYWRREHLLTLIARFKCGAEQLNLPLMPSNTPIQPLLLKSNSVCSQLSEQLENKGILATAIRPPTVPENTARIRFTFSAAHTLEDIDYLLSVLSDLFPTEN